MQGSIEVEDNLELPLTLQLKDTFPGEPLYLRRRNFPKAIRFFKQKEEVDKHKFYLQELMMFYPFRSESELFPDDEMECEEIYITNRQKIDTVKAKVLPFMECVEAARRKFQEEKENEEPDLEDVAAMLDPEKEQEIVDVEEEDEEEHPEYLHIDPDQVNSESKEEETKKKKVFRVIDIPSNQVRLEEARQLDKMQKYVLSVGLGFAKDLVKARKGKKVLHQLLQ